MSRQRFYQRRARAQPRSRGEGAGVGGGGHSAHALVPARHPQAVAQATTIALAERVNGILKDKFLFVIATDLAQARQLVGHAVQRYNDERPRLALPY